MFKHILAAAWLACAAAGAFAVDINKASLAELEAVLDRGLIAMISDETGFHGLITRTDLLNHLRRKLK